MMRQRSYLVLFFLASTLVSGCALVTNSQHPTEDYTPLFAAASNGDLATVRQNVEKNPSLVKVTEWDHATLLHDAVGQKQEAVAAYLLTRGADVNAVTSDGLTPLHMAAQNGDIPIIKLLLSQKGVFLDPIDSKGWTPLDRAEKWGHPEAAAFLKQHNSHEAASLR